MAPGCTLLISVAAEENTGGIAEGNGAHSLLRVISKLSLPSSSANIIDSGSAGDTSNTLDMSVQGMVMKAAGNVLASLKKDLAGLVIEKEEKIDQETNSYGSLHDLTYSGMDQSKDPPQGGQTSRVSTSSPTSRLKPLSVSDIGPDESNGALVMFTNQYTLSVNDMTTISNQYTFLCVS